ncbi:MAG: polyhydroxyalkanoic acid system family protein [Archangium sp.]|nr:polyhydroxyalkanoic acid system family protein [Archangium sp.]
MRRHVTCALVCFVSAATYADDKQAAAPAVVADTVSSDELALTVPHTLAQDEARERVTQLLAYWAQRFGLQSEWNGARVTITGAVLGIAVNAWFEVGEAKVWGMSNSPGRLFARAVHSYARGLLRKYLHPTYAAPSDERSSN